MKPLSVIELNGLPWPVSVNSLYNTNRQSGKRYLKQSGKDYHWLVRQKVNDQLSFKGRPLTQRLDVDIYAYPPDDWRRHDLDNILKVMLDSLEYSQVFVDDSQIDRMMIERRSTKKHAYVDICIREYSKLKLTSRRKTS